MNELYAIWFESIRGGANEQQQVVELNLKVNSATHNSIPRAALDRAVSGLYLRCETAVVVYACLRMQSVCEHCVQSRVCSACSPAHWMGPGVRVAKGWVVVEIERYIDRERERGRLHVQKRVLAHLANCHLGLARKRGGSNTLAFYSRALTNGCGKDGGFLSLRLVLSVNTLKENRPYPPLPPIKNLSFKICWNVR